MSNREITKDEREAVVRVLQHVRQKMQGFECQFSDTLLSGLFAVVVVAVFHLEQAMSETSDE